MGGGGGRSYFDTTGDLGKLRDESVQRATDEALEGEVNALLGELLAAINDRDVDTVSSYIESITESLENVAEEVVTLLFGGSVAKHTYVDGLSDIDALVIMEETDQTPAAVIADFAAALRDNLELGTVEEGSLAVTVTYPDGTVIQLLPALRRGETYSIADASGQSWSTIRPDAFASKLTETNKAMVGRLVPMIKLAKSIIGDLPENRRVSGYHAESLAIQAFRDYEGPRTLKQILTHYFTTAAQLVTRPIQDSTGQSIHVDDDLGAAGSLERKLIADAFGRIGRRMQNATSVDQWQSILET